ncbi:putative serine/threonine-protein kinase roco5, partial [Stylophora pistillata]
MRTEAANCPGDSHLPSKHQTGYTPMHCAAFGGHDECLKIMLNWPDGDPNVVDPTDGRTPVHLAAWKGNGVCLRLLLRKGGNLRQLDSNENTPISLARDPYCLAIIVYHLYETEFKLNVEGSIELIWRSLCRENRSMVSAPIRELQDPRNAGRISQSSHEELKIYAFSSNAGFSRKPYKVLARGELAVEIFNQALREGKACISRMQLTVIGDVGVGKTSLVRSLSGEDFEEERKETHGIDTSMVERTELDESWHAADPNKSQVDEILADKVCQGIQRSPRHSLTRGGKSSREIPIDEIMRRLSLSSEASLGESEKKYAKISIWDFAGHSLYEAMHHVFLNRRSFYLTVLNLARLCDLDSASQVLEEAHFWLNSISVHAPHTTPVFLVGTHSGEVSEKDMATAEKTIYDKFVEKFGQQLVKSKENSFLFPVENTFGGKDPGAVALKKAIENEAARLRKMDEELPLLWLHFEEEILKCREEQEFPPCVRKPALKQMLEQITSRSIDDREFGSMLQFYHDSGVIILPEMCQKHNQIRIKARYKNEKKLHELFYILKTIMTDICQRQFRFLKFRFGPTCPNPRCPGSSSEGTVLPVDTSSDGSDNDDNDDAECGERESYVDSPTEEPVEPCCLALVAKELAYKWNWLGRSLSVPDTVIETIQAENQSEEERAYQVLTRWSRKMGSVGTVHALMKAIQEVGDVPPLEAFDRHLGDRHV